MSDLLPPVDVEASQPGPTRVASCDVCRLPESSSQVLGFAAEWSVGAALPVQELLELVDTRGSEHEPDTPDHSGAPARLHRVVAPLRPVVSPELTSSGEIGRRPIHGESVGTGRTTLGTPGESMGQSSPAVASPGLDAVPLAGGRPGRRSRRGGRADRNADSPVRTYACPTCGAPAGAPCIGRRGPRVAHHVARRSAAPSLDARERLSGGSPMVA